MNLLVHNLSAERVLMALYNRAAPQGLGFLRATPAPLSYDEANELLTSRIERRGDEAFAHFDYVRGRPIKVQIGIAADGGVIIRRADLFDRDAGAGAARDALVGAGGRVVEVTS